MGLDERKPVESRIGGIVRSLGGTQAEAFAFGAKLVREAIFVVENPW